MGGESQVVPVILVGYGRMGRFHASCASRFDDGLQVTAVVDPQAEARQRARHDLGAAVRVYSDLDMCLARQQGHCLIASATDQHGAAVAAALDSDRHVFCEKPLTLDQSESVALQQLANRRGLVLQTGFYRRHCWVWQAARQLTLDGAVGAAPVLIRLSQWDAELAAGDMLDPAVGGGLIVDFGVHEFDLLHWLTGDHVETVSSFGREFPDHVGSPVRRSSHAHACVVVAELSSGAVGVVDLGMGVRYEDDVRGEIVGPAGRIFVETIPEGRVSLGDAGGLRRVPLPPPPYSAEVFVDAVAAEHRAFVRAALDGHAVTPTAADSVAAMSVARAATQSLLEGGRRIAVPPYPC